MELRGERKSEITDLRGGMVGQAEKMPLPSFITAEASVDTPTFWLTDTRTGRTTQVPLCNYRGVRKALHELFGDADG